MHVSLYEIWKITQRVLEGAPVPKGYDREGAFATMWLQERGFPAFDIFAGLDMETAASWRLSIDELGMSLDASGAPLISLGVDVIDLAIAKAELNESQATITVKNACVPLFLIPYAARHCHNSGVCKIEWRQGGVEFLATIASGSDIWIESTSGNLEALSDLGPVEPIKVTFDVDGGALRAGDGVPDGAALTPDELKARQMAMLENGPDVDPEPWARLSKLARKVLVPETELSREIGAGGGDANE